MAHVAMLNSQENLTRIFSDLKSKHEERRIKAADELRETVATASRELSDENLIRLTNDVNKRIFELAHGSDNHEKLGAIIAIDRLIDLEPEGNSSRYNSYLSLMLPYNDPLVMIPAARALGRLAISSSTFTADFVDTQVEHALEWLQGDRSRLAAVLVLRELAINAPTLIYAYVPRILELVWLALRDSRPIIRENAADCLSQCLEIVQQRETPLRRTWYARIWEEVNRGLRNGSAETIHGSLLVMRELLLHAGMFMTDMYRDVCDITLRFKDSRDLLIRKTVVAIIPTLASYDPTTFAELYLRKSMSHLLSLLKKDRDKRDAFITIGKIAIQVKSNIGPYLDATLLCIKETLTVKGRQRKEIEAPIFVCISMLATAVGQALTKYMHDLLDLMFNCGLSESLVSALSNIADRIKPLSHVIQGRLLNVISVTLSGQPYKQPGAPTNRNIIQTVERPLREGTVNDTKDNYIIVLALKTLGSFDFSSHILNEFVRDCIVNYLDDDMPEIRKAAAVTCCQLFVRDPICNQTSAHAIKVVGEVLEKLLTVGIADPDAGIRQTVLSSLDIKFDRHLAQADNVRSLFIALNDEVFSIREIAITIIGRLTTYNPAYVMPSLRKTLIQLLTELEYSVVSRHKEESARLVSLLVSAAQRLTKPYIEPILKVLLPKARDASPGVVSAVLGALGELAAVSGEDMIPHLDELMPLIMETLQDQSSSAKRDAALKTLGQLASNTGFVIEPYTKYPALLSILINILKTEQNVAIRRETVKLMGILGALDPYRHKMNAVDGFSEALVDPKLASNDVTLLMMGVGPSSEDYYPQVVMHSLMKILRDPSLSQHHYPVIEAIMSIFKTLGLKVVQFLPLVIPGFLSLMRSCTPNMLGSYFHKLSELVGIVKQHVRNYLMDIFDLIDEYWTPESSIQITIISLIESIAKALDGELKVYLPRLLPHMLQIFDGDLSERRQPTIRVLHAFVVFGANIEEYMHLVIPAIVKFFEKPDAPIAVRRQAMVTITSLCKKVNMFDYASRIIHPLARILPVLPNDARNSAMDLLCALVFQLGTDYAKFIPVVNKVLMKYRITHTNYELLVGKLLKGENLPQELGKTLDDRDTKGDETPSADLSTSKKQPVNQQHLKKAWEASQRSTKEDWMEWIRRLSLELLKQSPSHALRACVFLAGYYPPLARELFNAAFVSCWNELYDQYQEELVRSLETALKAPNIPPEIIQILLHLAEFMEHDNKMLPIDIRTLAVYAQKCHAYAKALHYKETEFHLEQSFEAVEMLMSINNLLQQPDAAMGILTFAQDSLKLERKVSWYEKLHRYQDALDAYEAQQKENPNSMEITLGRMRCLHALGEWDQLATLAQEKWIHAPPENRKNMAPFAAAAAWGLGHFEQMEEYIALLKTEGPDRTFFRAILAIHRNRYAEAEKFINKTRDLLDTELTALLGESYNRAYAIVVRVQMLAELEEMIIYKQSTNDIERQNVIRRTWMKRLEGCERNVEVWQRILRVRAMVISPQGDMEMWIKFANLCRKSGRFSLSEKTLRSLMEMDNGEQGTNSPHPKIVYAQLKHMWHSSDQNANGQAQALSILRDFTAQKTQDLGLNPDEMAVSMPIDPSRISDDVAEYTRLLARCYLRQGEWQRALSYELTEETIPDILRSFLLATRFDQNWYKAWHAWALANFNIIDYHEKLHQDQLPPQVFTHHVVPAVQGFFRSIALSKENSLQDTLRLLTLWFKYGYQAEVSTAISEGFGTISIDVWLQVIPQLIARIHAPNATVRLLIHQLLTDIGREHPQALVYSLTVASKSQSVPRKRATFAIIDRMRMHSAALVDQALMVSQELIRVAILWHEMWHEGLEEASRLHFIERNVEAMFATLEPLHQMLDRGPETMREESFVQAFGRDLQEAQEWCHRYQETRDLNNLNQAWELYYQVFKRIQRQLPQLTSLELQYISPRLLEARNLELCVPGYYRSNEPIIRIAKFNPSLSVIASKQRPRKLTIVGSDGKDYMYLLKGHEDLRQDERVMQLFGLVNTLLKNDAETFKRHLSIERCVVVPLSPNSGLIGWFADTDTFHTLIRDYRDSKKILLNIEHRLMLQMAPDYDNLTVIQKVEVFQFAFEKTGGQDLYWVLWLKSRNSEAWLDRRTNYTRSLAVMSMVGYILGLGDRHPSNLMLHRVTGKVVHIDFGDCFEVAMHREKFPEKIPFRLTRMLVKAMEVSGIEGNFRITCEHVMRVLRENKDSLMAVLEAFVYDPLINWRLLNNTNPSPVQNRDERLLGMDRLNNEDMAEDGHRNFSVSRRLNRIEVEAVANENVAGPEMLNSKAVVVVNRVSNKLTGRDFNPRVTLDVPTQVDKLIQQATSLENLCQCYIGWCAFW
ncbi:armadillo-type protein [Halteromyces radiatus]|uniref:armadillo-type protein n=1 Tax=Halteromyces radiatus TaxID=101107 RepID=UPI00221FE5A5|nr:armadillo-type protein [Halteromyces radiatus]KAI8098676.1 armadillo-type protein [Halteromyces radiatus]